MLTSDQLYAVAGVATVAGGAVGWLAGHLRTTRRYERDGGLMDQTYDEGRDDARGVPDHDAGHADGVDRQDPATALLAVPDVPAQEASLRVREAPGADVPPAEGVTDFLHPDFEQLDPARLDAANQDLPGPAIAGRDPGLRAGEHHQHDYQYDVRSDCGRCATCGATTDVPLPSVLSLGTEYDGGPQTAARVAWRLWDMTARYEQERARFRAECGLGIAA